MLIFSIGLFLFVWIISLIIWFYFEWITFPSGVRTMKNVIKWMSWMEFMPIVNTMLLTLIVGMAIIAFLSVFIIDNFKKICNKFVFPK